MAGTATHLAVADKIYEILGNGIIKNLPLFYSGNIAPDAIHTKLNYQRADKKRTHLTEGILNSDFQNPDMLVLFHQRMNEFINTYYAKEDIYADLYLGYIVHLITDELFNIHIREQFVTSMKKEGIEQENPEFFKRIIRDIESIDHIVVKQYPYKHDVRSNLEQVWDYEIKDYVGTDELNRSKKWVIDTYLNGNTSVEQTLYYDYDSTYRFILYASENIVNRLSAGIDYIKILLNER